jgi:hypothetical protein
VGTVGLDAVVLSQSLLNEFATRAPTVRVVTLHCCSMWLVPPQPHWIAM